MAVVEEDRGLEPLTDFGAAEDVTSISDTCPDGTTARALHSGGPDCHFLSSLDPDLQRVIAAWDGLPIPIRLAIVGLAAWRR
jgi:hypothetical protein